MHRIHPVAACIALAATAGVPAVAAAQAIVLASNEAVLAHWARMTLGAPPQLVQVGPGRTRVLLNGQTALDLYSQSANGGETLTPVRSGEFYRLQAAAQMRAEDERGGQSWMQLGFTQSNDRAVVAYGHQFDVLQLGWSDAATSLSLGDVVVSHSALGASTALRGALVQGDTGAVQWSGAAGAIAESWEALSDPDRRLQPLRNAYALKASTALADAVVAYATVQGYADDSSGEIPALRVPASSNAATLGLNAVRGRLTLELEAGVSRFRQQAQDAEGDRALRADAVWRFEAVRVSAGHHDLGRFYSALSAQALPGVKESYVNVGWAAASWASLIVDLRRSENRWAAVPAAGTVQTALGTSTRAISGRLQANLVSQSVPGLTGSVAVLRGGGTQADGGENDRRGVEGQIAYATPRWSASASGQNDAIATGSGATSGRTQTWSAALTRAWPEGFALPFGRLTQASLGLSANLLSQRLDIGLSTALHTYTLNASGDASWGRLTAQLAFGRGSDSTAGRIEQDSFQLEGTRPLGERGTLKLYARSTRYEAGTLASYREAAIGMQLAYSF